MTCSLGAGAGNAPSSPRHAVVAGESLERAESQPLKKPSRWCEKKREPDNGAGDGCSGGTSSPSSLPSSSVESEWSEAALLPVSGVLDATEEAMDLIVPIAEPFMMLEREEETAVAWTSQLADAFALSRLLATSATSDGSGRLTWDAARSTRAS